MVELLGQRASAFFICIEITKVPSWRGNLHFLSSLPSLDTIILHNLCPPDGFKKCFILLRVFLIVDGAEQIFIRLLATVFLFLLPSVCALDPFYPLDSSSFSHWPWALRKPAAMGPFSVMHSADMSSHFAVNLWLCQRPFCLAEVLLCPAVRFVHPFVFLDILVALELSLSLSAGRNYCSGLLGNSVTGCIPLLPSTPPCGDAVPSEASGEGCCLPLYGRLQEAPHFASALTAASFKELHILYVP